MAARTSLTGVSVSDGYPQLLHISNSDGNTTNMTQVYDGNGTAVPIFLSTTGIAFTQRIEIATDNVVVTVAQSGTNFMIGTDAKTFTLPATFAGGWYKFTNIGADANNNVRVVPNSSDYIAGTITLASSVVDLGTTDNKYVDNTKVSSIAGDSIIIIGDGVGGWYVTASTGIWASE